MARRNPGYRMTLEEAAAFLGVDSDATPADTKAAYRRGVAIHHPDRGGDPELMKKLNAAREVVESRGAITEGRVTSRERRETEWDTWRERHASKPSGRYTDADLARVAEHVMQSGLFHAHFRAVKEWIPMDAILLRETAEHPAHYSRAFGATERKQKVPKDTPAVHLATLLGNLRSQIKTSQGASKVRIFDLATLPDEAWVTFEFSIPGSPFTRYQSVSFQAPRRREKKKAGVGMTRSKARTMLKELGLAPVAGGSKYTYWAEPGHKGAAGLFVREAARTVRLVVGRSAVGTEVYYGKLTREQLEKWATRILRKNNPGSAASGGPFNRMTDAEINRLLRAYENYAPELFWQDGELPVRTRRAAMKWYRSHLRAQTPKVQEHYLRSYRQAEQDDAGRAPAPRTRRSRTPPADDSFEVGQIVVFGRKRGEQTLARVVRLSARSITVETLEARGAAARKGAGRRWRVGRSLVRAATAAEAHGYAAAPKRSKAPQPTTRRSKAALTIRYTQAEGILLCGNTKDNKDLIKSVYYPEQFFYSRRLPADCAWYVRGSRGQDYTRAQVSAIAKALRDAGIKNVKVDYTAPGKASTARKPAKAAKKKATKKKATKKRATKKKATKKKAANKKKAAKKKATKKKATKKKATTRRGTRQDRLAAFRRKMRG